MEYTIEYDNKTSICVICVMGVHRRPQDSRELLRIAGSNLAEHDCSHFLFDMRKATIIGDTIDAFNTAIDPEKFGFYRFFRIAAVYEVVSQEDKFMETVAVNRGSFNFQIFDDINVANDWLNEAAPAAEKAKNSV